MPSGACCTIIKGGCADNIAGGDEQTTFGKSEKKLNKNAYSHIKNEWK